MRFTKIFTTAIFIFLSALSVFAQKQAEVVVTSTYLRKAPDYNAEKIQTLQKGEKVTLEKGREAGSWTYVSIAGGTIKGWILSATIQPVKTTEKLAPKPDPAPRKPVQKPLPNPETNLQTANKTPQTVAPTKFRRPTGIRQSARHRRRRQPPKPSKTTTKFCRSIPRRSASTCAS